MSKLDSFIRRMLAQRDCIDMACEMIAGVRGVVLELGLGTGRTYSHLSERLPDRDIYVFDRAVSRHAVAVPPENRLILGEIEETLPPAVERFRGRAALVHTDVGAADPGYSKRMAAFVGATLAPALMPGALVLSDQKLELASTEELPLPDGVAAGRYYIYRTRAAPASPAA